MKRIARMTLGIAWIIAILACTFSSNIPSILPGVITATPSITPTSTASPTPAPTYTPIPSVRIQNADQALFNGDLQNAESEYRAAFAGSSDPTVQAAALWGLARTQYIDGRNADVLAALQQLNSGFPDSPFA